MEDRRIMAVRDGRRLPPRNSRGEFRRRRSRRDRGMDYAGEDMRMRDYGDVTRRGRYGDYGEDMRRGDYAGDMRGDYEGGDMRGRDYGEDMARGGRGRGRSDYGDYGMDGHYPQGQGGSTYYPIQAMGTFEGYYGMPEQMDYGRGGDYRRGSRMDYGYDMRGRGRGRDYGYDYGDYGDDYGDYGETLSDKELEEWNKKLIGQLDEREKQMFSKDAIMQKIKQMNKPMEGFGEKELYTTMLMLLTDYKMTLPANPDTYLRLAYDWLSDKDVAVKGAQKLAVYYDCIVEGEE